MSLDTLISKGESIDLSGDDILRICDNKVVIHSYHDLANMDNIDEVLGKYGACIILYETKENFGHWTSLFIRSEGMLEFFDSYGFSMDSELNYAKYNNTPYLSNLVKASNYKVVSGSQRLQKLKYDVNTCGRWNAIRIVLRNLNIAQFYELFRNNTHYDGDWFATALTYIYVLKP